MSINKVLISGNLTRESELRATPSGMEVLQFGVAVNDRRKNNQTGQWEDYPNYVDCVMFGKRAGSLSQYLHKGNKVAIEGKLRWSSWEDRNGGGKRSKLEVVVDEIELMSSQQGYQQQRPQRPQQQQQQQKPQRPQQQQYQQQQPQGGYQEEYYDSDCPF